jgi:MFS-type transporter involved in bile tolerance (Atg22 family)
VGKAAAIAGPYIFGNLKDATGSTTWSLTFVAIVTAVGGSSRHLRQRDVWREAGLTPASLGGVAGYLSGTRPG